MNPSIDRLIDPESFTEFSADTLAADAAACESAGAGGFWSVERLHDPFLPLAYAAAATTTIALGTSVTVALSRSPMTLAYAAHDLQALTKGRFILGLGPQHQSHVANRFSMPSDRPLGRMREYVGALRAIWKSWNTHRPLNFRGQFYTHTLMPPYVSPPPNPYGPPRIFLAAVGPKMAELAGEIADGVIAPPFSTVKHLTEVLLPAVERGLTRSGRTRADFTIMCLPMTIVGDSPLEQETAAASARLQLAFHSSPADARALFDLHGLAHLGDQVTEIFLSGAPDQPQRMQRLITDEILDLFTLTGRHDDILGKTRTRFAHIADRIAPVLYTAEPHHGQALTTALRATTRTP
ncbi:TIGR03617 family F420-dependent LLM class oxidoreductase [Nocardia huaxiensis]|uniref:TIGR03617 family F420-dependent LLM class oxidoreductase n=1 Tax=Nocardia huaxiensis TaxID=2755382 RepID=UPI001E38B3C0|nr:TIGR03617 family F420-dependent LLM class oxidoreductase [Nocardia huaxiensis]UFS98474.1 TIGR03617 family F420-dependent LLM class oxidoreductase [Nocardia huaxiensis]